MVDKKTSKFEEYKYAIIVGAGGALLLIVALLLIGRPLWNNYKTTKEELASKREVLAKLEEKLENLKVLKEKEGEIKEKAKKVTAALPSDKDISRLFVQFENIATQNGLSISSVQEEGAGSGVQVATGDEAVSQTTVKAVSYTVNGEAKDYASLKKSLSKIEDALRILNVSKIDVSENSGKITVTLTVSTYLRGENQ